MLAFQSVSWQPASTTAPAKTTTTATAATTTSTRGHNQTKDYAVALLAVVIIQYLCCRNQQNPQNIEDPAAPKSLFAPKSTKMGDRLNIGREVRELKLGSTFNPQNSQTAFHTIKYDFKPASVDLNRVATVDVGSNNQVTVTVPNLESSGVPHTVFKGNQRKYTKECLIIIDRKTGTVTLERLNHNIQVKKTRSEVQNKAPVIPPAPQKFENNTQRTQSKTRVSTGSRKNNIIGFVPRNSPMQQGSPSSYSSTHKSPQSAPAKCNSSRWNANNAQATLPSIPLIEVDDDMGMPSMSEAIGGTSSTSTTNNSAPLMSANTSASNNSDFHHQQQHHQQQQPQMQYHNQNSIPHMNSNSIGNNASSATQSSSANTASSSLASAAAALEREICESGAALSCSSDSSSDSDSSGSGSDSDDSGDDAPPKQNHQQQQPNQFQNYANGSFPALLHDDLQLSESCSSDSDD